MQQLFNSRYQTKRGKFGVILFKNRRSLFNKRITMKYPKSKPPAKKTPKRKAKKKTTKKVKNTGNQKRAY